MLDDWLTTDVRMVDDGGKPENGVQGKAKPCSTGTVARLGSCRTRLRASSQELASTVHRRSGCVIHHAGVIHSLILSFPAGIDTSVPNTLQC
jgi:hypothetical protein